MKVLLKISLIFLLSLFSFFNSYAEEEASPVEEVEVVEEAEVVEEVFSIIEVETISFNEVKLIFNANLENTVDASREFRIVNRDDYLDELEVINTVLDEEDNKNLFVTFDKDSLPNWEYELTVLDLRDEAGRNIEFWIEWIAFFIMPDKFELAVEETENIEIAEVDESEEMDLNSAEEIEEVEEVNEEVVNTVEENNTEKIEEVEEVNEEDLNSASNVEEENESVMSWEDMDESEVIKNTVSESENIDKLPQTWPWYILILILSIMLWTLIFVLRLKKS